MYSFFNNKKIVVYSSFYYFKKRYLQIFELLYLKIPEANLVDIASLVTYIFIFCKKTLRIITIVFFFNAIITIMLIIFRFLTFFFTK